MTEDDTVLHHLVKVCVKNLLEVVARAMRVPHLLVVSDRLLLQLVKAMSAKVGAFTEVTVVQSLIAAFDLR